MAHAAVSDDRFTARVESFEDDAVVLRVPGTDYRLRLVLAAPLGVGVGDRVSGVVAGRAKRVDALPAGGRFVEPVDGRPRRVQGKVVAGDAAANTITVHAGGALVVATLTDPRQKPADFRQQQLVGFDVERGARFEAR